MVTIATNMAATYTAAMVTCNVANLYQNAHQFSFTICWIGFFAIYKLEVAIYEAGLNFNNG